MRPVPSTLLLLAAVAIVLATGQPRPAAAQRSPGNQDAPEPRRIAPAMSYVYADWLTRPEREREEMPDRVVKALRIPRGATVIDLGAGVGYFTWRLAKRVGREGRVIATDIQQQMLDLLARNMRKRGIENVETVLSTQDDPRLPEGEADLVLLVDVYHELAYPAGTMERVRRSLKPGGRLVVVEYRGEEPWVPIHPLHKMTLRQVRREIEPTGFEFVEVMDFVPSQHVVVFTPDEF
jgi:predicted methyltransferase